VVKLRLMRMGKKKQPTYRIVATDSRSPRDGRFIEILGHYNPREEPSALSVDNDKAVGWLRQGAQPSDTVRSILRRSGMLKARHEVRVAAKLQANAVPLTETPPPPPAGA
jgi:small subunit ribosomal protein S16